MNKYSDLALARSDMKKQNVLYRPSSFWGQASEQIVTELEENGIENFRSLPMITRFFVPTYGSPGNSFSLKQIEQLMRIFQKASGFHDKSRLALTQFLDGYLLALSDFRVLKASDDESSKPYLHKFSESTYGNPLEHFDFEGRNFSRSSLNYLLGLSLLKKHLGNDIPKTVLEIGGGFGTLGEVLAASGVEGLRYIDVDIPPASYVAEHYLSEVLGKEQVATYVQTRKQNKILIDDLPKISVLCTWQIEQLQGDVDLFVNFISFQEMEPHIVKNYLQQVERLGTKWILLRNMREGKQVRKTVEEVGVETPVTTENYLEMLPQYELVDRNVIPFGFKTVDGFHSELLLFKHC